MSEMIYTYVNNSRGRSITVFLPGFSNPIVVNSTHMNFASVLTAVRAGDEDAVRSALDLDRVFIDALAEVGSGFDYANGTVTYQGEPVPDRLSAVIVDIISNEGTVAPFAKFAARLHNNPSRHSRESLFGWIKNHGINIDSEGYMIAYKGVQVGDGGDYVSITAGRGSVNGIQHNGHLRNNVGDVVEVPRRDVDDNTAVHCSYGLHAGTYRYASGFARGVLLSVRIDPADVVSVPNDGYEKVRVCRYTVISTVEGEWTKTALWNGQDAYSYLDEALDDDFADEFFDGNW